jgi:hypothetical protein
MAGTVHCTRASASSQQWSAGACSGANSSWSPDNGEACIVSVAGQGIEKLQA